MKSRRPQAGTALINLDWPAGQSVGRLLQRIERDIGPRRMRLLAVAFCARIAHLLPDDACRAWLEVARRYADGQARRTDLVPVHDAAERRYDRSCGRWKTPRQRATTWALRAVRWATHPTQLYYAQSAANDAAEAANDFANADTPDPAGYLEADLVEHPAECAAQLQIIRDVLGWPLVPAGSVECWRAWEGAEVLRLARTIYQEQRFEAMPLLGEALAAAGCTDAAILAHARQPGEHVRGCWLLDLVLGKE
ncbi:MAG: hypothetical protein L0Z62_49625 [Gemmataceae bacterium]|nr:hypothetical protein [Gemmataceae bacterium]